MNFGESLSPEMLKQFQASVPDEERIQFIKKHPKLTNEDLIKWMRTKGIKFEIMNEQIAFDKMNSENYYFKIGAYRLNFEKNNQQKYEYLDFAYLDNLASLDRKLRYIIMQISLDLEHSLKTKLLTSISYDDSEDGYEIVKRFELEKHIEASEIIMKHTNPFYLNRIQSKHERNPSIWVLLELMSMGELSKFIEFYYEYTSFHKMEWKEASQLIRYAKNIRNAAAHSNPILIDLYGKRKFSISGKKKGLKSNQILVNTNSKMGLEKDVYQNPKVNDFLSLMYLHNKYASKNSRLNKIDLLENFSKQCVEHKDYYINNEKLQTLYKSLNIVIDYYKDDC